MPLDPEHPIVALELVAATPFLELVGMEEPVACIRIGGRYISLASVNVLIA